MSFESVASIGLQALKHRQEIGAALKGVAGLANLAGNQSFGKIFEKQIQNQQNNSKPGLNTLQGLSGLSYFDADGNRQISKQEITDGLQKLNAAGLGQSGAYAKLNEFGQKLLQNYDKVSALDGNGASLSYLDLGKLAGQDQQAASISDADWQKVLS
jgi:hypothetical protein